MKKSTSKQKVLIRDEFDKSHHENEQLKHRKMPFGSGVLIQLARKVKGYSQKEFATVSEFCI